MNEEMLKTTLLEIIKEAENLPENELEVIPGTRIHVKKGRVDEFKANARFYYGLKNNVIVNNDDYIKEVYYELSDELARVEREHVLSKAYELYSMNKSELDRLDALNRSLAINANDREKYRKALADLNSRNISDPKTWEEITNLQNSLKTLSENEIIIRNAIAEIKDKVNNEIKKAVEEEMKFLRESYLNTRAGTSIGFGLDGASILAKDKENYDNLYILLKIIENVNEKDPIISVDNTLCVNPHQVDAVKELLPKINFLSLVKKEEIKEAPKEENPNDKIIASISKELERLREKIKNENLPSDELEYDNLIKILQILNRANNTEFALTPVWDIAYVNGIDKEPFINLLKNTEYFKGYNPDLEKVKENEILISKLKGYLTSLEDKVRNYQGLTNIPLTQVANAVVLPEDKQEYENVLAIINILQNSKENLISISEGGNVASKDMPKYKELLNNTKYFTPNFMAKKVEEQNGPLIKEVEQELTDLIKKAKATPNATLAEGKEILASDLEEYNLLSRKYAILKNANPNSDLAEINGALINSDQAEAYQQVAKELEEAKIKKGTSSSGQSSSASTSSEEESKKKDTPSSSTETLTSEEEKSNEESKSSEEDKKKSPKEPLKRRAVKAIRKCKPETINWWKKNWKKLALIGVSSFVVLYTLSTLAPTIVYANSCLAMANPALSGVLGGINSTIINTLGLTLGELNLNVAASQAFAALATALGKVGIIGIGTVGAVKGIKGLIKQDENRLPDPNRKTVARRILDLGEKLIDKSKELGKTLSAKASEFTENLAYATNANNMELEKEVMDAKMGFDPDIKDVEPLDDNFEEIEKNVQNQVEEEKRQMIEDRINERFNRIKHAEDAEYIRPTALSDEPVIKGPASEPAPVTITIPTDDEIYATFSDKDVQLGRVDNYIDAMQSGDTKKASEYQQLVLKDTNIDLSKYDMNNYKELVQARSDVANYMNYHDTKISKNTVLAYVDNYIDAIKSNDTTKASEYQKLVFDETGIDLSKYNMNNYEELVQARSDVANFMNQIDTTKRSR